MNQELLVIKIDDGNVHEINSLYCTENTTRNTDHYTYVINLNVKVQFEAFDEIFMFMQDHLMCT